MQVADGNLFLPVAFHQGLKRAGVAFGEIVVVIVGRAIVGPITQIFQNGVRIRCRPFRTLQINQGMAPQIPGPVDSLAERHQGLLCEAGRQIPQIGVEAAGHFLPPVALHACHHEM